MLVHLGSMHFRRCAALSSIRDLVVGPKKRVQTGQADPDPAREVPLECEGGQVKMPNEPTSRCCSMAGRGISGIGFRRPGRHGRTWGVMVSEVGRSDAVPIRTGAWDSARFDADPAGTVRDGRISGADLPAVAATVRATVVAWSRAVGNRKRALRPAPQVGVPSAMALCIGGRSHDGSSEVLA